MLRWSRFIPVLAILVVGIGCDSGRHSASGFRLPPDGSAERGKAAFLAFGCVSCHDVAGVDLPKPQLRHPIPIVLGGTVTKPMSDGYLTTAIIYPSFRLAAYPKSEVAVGDESKMPHFTTEMTVQQLVDVVEFLQSAYKVREVPVSYGYR